MILSSSAVLPLSSHPDPFPTLYTEGTQNVSRDNVSATTWDTLIGKDVGQRSERGHNPQVYDISYMFCEL